MDDAEVFSVLFGARCTEPVTLGEVEVRPLSWSDLHRLDKSDVVIERAGRWLGTEMMGGPMIVAAPSAIVTLQAPSEDGRIPWPVRHAEAVLALRLAGLASFIDPAWSLWVEDQGMLVHRHVGPYRMHGYSLAVTAEDLITPEHAAAASLLMSLVDERRCADALRPVRALSAPSLDPNGSVMLSLQLLEGLYGRANRRIAGLDYAERLTRAGVPEIDARWLSDGADGGGRSLRNAVAHGRAADPEGAARLAGVARRATRCFVETEPDPDGTDPIDAFRRAAWS